MSDKNSDKPKPISDKARKIKINRRKMAKKSRLANKRSGK